MKLTSTPLETTAAALLTALAGLVCIAGGVAQGAEPAAGRVPADGATRYIVQFRARSFDLRGFRTAVRRRAPAEEMRRVVAGLAAAARRDQAEFVTAVRRLGGRVTAQWWLINGCAIELQARSREAVSALPNVERIDLDRVRRPFLADATDSSHHGSDQANKMKDRGGADILGTGVAIAVLDTGADADSGSTMRPHRCYFPGGDPGNNTNGGVGGSLLLAATKVQQVSATEDTTGHGTAVSACAAANRWNALAGVDDGVAPGSGVVSVNIADRFGLSLDSWMVTGWQMVAALRTQHGIGVGNSSFEGDPFLGSALQRALDSAASNADILICVAAGNSGASTQNSQHAYNGLAVGSVDKVFLTKSSFSAIGPLHGTLRTYPDITAVGNALVTALHDNEASRTVVGGTSYAAPLVAGAAALLRQADPGLDATAVKALLLNTTLFRSGNRNHYGIGFMKADAAVTAALAGEVGRGTAAQNRPVANFSITPTAAGMTSVTVAWMRTELGYPPPDLDLRVFDGSQTVATDLNRENSYESVRFAAVANRTYRAEVTWSNPTTQLDPVAFAISGAIDRSVPAITAVQPGSFPSYAPVELEVTGTGLARTTEVRLDGQSLPFQVMDGTTLRIQPPALLPLGTGRLTVKSAAGTSNALTLTVTPPSQPVLAGSNTALRGPTRHPYSIHSDKDWLSLLMVSTSDKPSVAPGLFQLGIGDNFSELVLLVYLRQDASGSSSVELVYPASMPGNLQVFFQAMTADPNLPALPYPATNVLPVRIL